MPVLTLVPERNKIGVLRSVLVPERAELVVLRSVLVAERNGGSCPCGCLNETVITEPRLVLVPKRNGDCRARV